MTEPLASSFARLRRLLHGISAPSRIAPIQLHLGEVREALTAEQAALLSAGEGWVRYPPVGGTPQLRESYLGWLRRRFELPDHLLEGRLAVEPTPGTKQAISAAIALAVARARSRGVAEPAVVLPNPLYHAYLAATVAAGARAHFYTLASGDDESALPAAIRAVGGRAAAAVVCRPGAPCGELLSPDGLRKACAVAASNRATVLVDECYIDTLVPSPSRSVLNCLLDADSKPAYLAFHSLSKRSGAPGLRSGFLAGDPETVDEYARFNRACGVSSPLPICRLASELWKDEERVRQLQARLAANWRLSDEALAQVPAYRKPKAGYFVWLPVGDDETVARRLWRYHAVSVMPGRYLGAADHNGRNPGANHVRIALVHEDSTMREALSRIRQTLIRSA